MSRVKSSQGRLTVYKSQSDHHGIQTTSVAFHSDDLFDIAARQIDAVGGLTGTRGLPYGHACHVRTYLWTGERRVVLPLCRDVCSVVHPHINIVCEHMRSFTRPGVRENIDVHKRRR